MEGASKKYKPAGYNSLSPYLVVKDARNMIELLTKVFDATPLRRYESPEGRIVHAEMRIDDSVVMLADATEAYPETPTLIHVYVDDVSATYARAVEAGCVPVEEPREREGDPDCRGGFRDPAGNHWSVSTQVSDS